jgi:hypothetical protein
MSKLCKPEYLAKVQSLSKLEAERLLSRMAGKLPRRLEKDKLSREEALAIQLELEDEQLQQWRKMMRILNKREEGKRPAKATPKAEAPAKPKAKTKTKTIEKAKVAKESAATAKPKAVRKSKTVSAK